MQRKKVLDVAGLDAEQNGNVMQFEHAWLKVKLPGSEEWVELDPSWKFKDYQAGLAGLLEELPFHDDPAVNDDLVDLYLGEERKELAYEFYEAKVREYLAEYYPDMTIADVAYDGPILAQSFDALPEELPYLNIFFSDSTTIPTVRMHRIRVTLTQGATSLFGDPIKLELPEMCQERLTVYPKSYGEDVKPQLYLDGQLIAEWTGTALDPNATVTLKVEHLDGDGDNDVDGTLERNRKAGQCLAVALDANQVSEELINLQRREVNAEAINVANGETVNYEKLIGGTLNLASLTYFYETDHGEEVIAGLTHGHRVANYVSSGIVTSNASLRAEMDMDQQIPYLPESLGIDIPRGDFTIIPIDDDWSTNNERWRLAGYTGSAMEAGVWEELTNSDSISTIKSLQIAGSNVVTITRDNVDNTGTLLDGLSTDSSQALEDAVVLSVEELVKNKQDFGDFAETDDNNQIVVSEYTVSYTDITSSDDPRLFNGKSETYFSGDFKHWIDVSCTSADDGSEVYLWSLYKDGDGDNLINRNTDDRIGVRFVGTSVDLKLELFQYVNEVEVKNESITVALNTTHYLLIERDVDGSNSTLKCHIYDNAERSGTPTTLTINGSQVTPDYSSIYSAYARGSSGAKQSGVISNLELRDRTVLVPNVCTNVGDPEEPNKMWKGVGYLGTSATGLDFAYYIHGGGE